MLRILVNKFKSLTSKQRIMLFVVSFLIILFGSIFIRIKSEGSLNSTLDLGGAPIVSQDQSGDEFDPNYQAFTDPPKGNKIIISGVEVDNFYEKAGSLESENYVPISADSGYSIAYYNNFNQFLISITESPFEDIRKDAEQILLTELNISEEEACKLDVIITTPRFANPDLAGQIFKLSFCE